MTGSIAVLERFFRSLEQEMLRALPVVPLAMTGMRDELATYLDWYHDHRPHQGLAGRTSAEVRDGVVPARERPRLEPRPRFPLPRGDPARRVRDLALLVDHVRGRPHLPIVSLRAA